MTKDELQAKIDAIKAIIRAQAPHGARDVLFQESALMGIDILGEIFMDIKRIAEKP